MLASFNQCSNPAAKLTMAGGWWHISLNFNRTPAADGKLSYAKWCCQVIQYRTAYCIRRVWITVLGSANADVLIYIIANFTPIATKLCVMPSWSAPVSILDYNCPGCTPSALGSDQYYVDTSVGLSVLMMGKLWTTQALSEGVCQQVCAQCANFQSD